MKIIKIILGIVDISSLPDVSNFKTGALEHIFEGEINRRGRAVGLHYKDYPTTKGRIIEGSKSTVNELGIYTGRVEVNGVCKVANGGKSTFFPEDWTPYQVVDAINEAYINREFVPGTINTYIGEISNGMQIEMYIDSRTNKIISAFPLE